MTWPLWLANKSAFGLALHTLGGHVGSIGRVIDEGEIVNPLSVGLRIDAKSLAVVQMGELAKFGGSAIGVSSYGSEREIDLSARVARSAAWREETQAGIDFQLARVANLVPGCAAHRVATDMLLLMQDTLQVLGEAHRLVTAANQALDNEANPTGTLRERQAPLNRGR